MRYADGSVDEERRIALVDLLDRVLAGGVVITGDVTLSIADVDLVQISLRALISSLSTISVTGIEPPVPRPAVSRIDE
ncbi:gas vesicle protein [Rhodococcus chondri]|uniref:Gas vesicle protein n=1 Tax=Rhodococcus chondri TaxID=3065941 RepID=A0ABU7JUJ1_9NOCA|nr:gas vesicle protein [Rhodococcus sp. CC-R104]MEE2033520.1 gas vesicle protein [Rhodococcus sp. CC-R104]